MENGKCRITVMEGDITRQAVDAVVNAANGSLLGGGGVDGAIHAAAGPGLLEECIKLNGCQTGDAKVTFGYALPARWIIHTVGPVYREGDSSVAEKLASAYRRSLEEAVRVGARTVAFPAISTGVYGYPGALAARVAVSAILSFLQTDSALEEVRLVCFSQESAEYHKAALSESSACRLPGEDAAWSI